MKPEINNNVEYAPLPIGFDDDRKSLNIIRTINRVLDDDSSLRGDSSKKSIQAKRRDWEILAPSFAEADTLEALRDVQTQGRVLDSLESRVSELGGTANTLNKRLDSMLWGLRAAGLEPEHVQRFKKNIDRVKKASGFTEGNVKGYSMEEWSSLAAALERICKTPGVFTYRQGKHTFTERSAHLTRAAAWVTVMGSLRISETCSIMVNEIDSQGFTYYIKKNRSYPEERYKSLGDCWQHVESYLKVRNAADDERLFTTSEGGLANMFKAAMEEAKIQPRSGRLGIHGFRHLFASHSLENDYGGIESRQHALGHKSPETQMTYTQDAAKDAAVMRVMGPWQDAVAEAAGSTFTWDYTLGSGYYEAMLKQEVPVVPHSAMGQGEVVYDGTVGHLGAPVCFHDGHVMMPLLDDEGNTFQWGIVEIKNFKPVRLIVGRRYLGMGPSGFEPESKRAFFEGYRAALNDLGVTPSK